MAIPIVIFSFLALLAVSVLVFYHYKITLSYSTTHEELKGVYSGYIYHPFSSFTWANNFKSRIVRIKIPKQPLF